MAAIYRTVWLCSSIVSCTFKVFLKGLLIFRCAILVMHPNSTITNKISMIIFNLKIVNSSRLVKFFNPMFLNKQIFAIYADKFITNEKISCIDKASALYIKRVIFGCDNLFTVNCQMYNLVYLSGI